MTTTGEQTDIDAPDGLVMTTLDIDKHAQALADMWNASDANWPGTWTGGVPETAEKVRLDYERSEAIETFVCLDGDVLAGFCKVSPDHDEPSVDYVALVNVPPSHQKRGVARRLLQRANALAVERGSYRLDLHTWSANLNAVPLYKKCGFMWMPDTDIHMFNFMPAVLRLDAAKEFFATRNWYEVFRRPLDQEPDEERWEGMKVFTYRFVDSPDDPADAEPSLVVRIDREARAICAVETTNYAVAATAARPDAPRGGEAKLRWTLTNKSDTPLPVTVVASGNEQLLIDYRGSAEVAPGETATLESSCRVAADAPDVKREKPVPAVKSVLLLGTQVVDLSTGLRPRPAFEITTWPVRITLLPGAKRTVEVRLRNRLDEAAEVDLRITPAPGLQTDWTDRSLSVDAEGWVSTKLDLEVPPGASAAYGLSISAAVQAGTTSLRVEPEPRHVFAVEPGAVLVAREKDCLRIENGSMRAVLSKEAGSLNLGDPTTGRSWASASSVIGPPMWPSEFWSLDYELDFESENGRVTARATAVSKRWPGILLRRNVRLNASALVELSSEVENRGSEARSLQLEQWAGGQGSHRTLPLASGIRQAAVWNEFPGPDDERMKKPEAWAERWSASEMPRDGRVTGIVWGTDVEEVGRSGVLTEAVNLEPQAVHAFEPLWLYTGPGTWAVLRDLWRRREGVVVEPDEPRPRIEGLVSARFEPSPLVVPAEGGPATLVIEHGATWALTGSAAIVPSAGWTAEPADLELTDTTWDRPGRYDVELRPPAGSRAVAGRTRVEVRSPEHDEDIEIPVLHLPEGKVEVGQTKASDVDVWRLSNGVAEIDVAPSFGGATVAFRVDGTEQFSTPFPEVGSIGWFLPWHGGIAPMMISGAASFPGQLWKESFAAEAVEDKDGRGLIWKGVRLTAESTHEDSRNLHVESVTLTIPNAPVIKHVLRVRNATGSLRNAVGGSLIFAAPGGDRDHTHLHSDGVHIKPSERVAWNSAGTWAAAVNSANGATLMAASTRDVGFLRFGLEGGHFTTNRSLEIPAGETKEVVTYIVAAESLEAALPWRALTEL